MELMTLRFNDETVEVLSHLTLAELLRLRGVEPDHVATACNGRFVPRAARALLRLQAGDHILTFQAITGG